MLPDTIVVRTLRLHEVDCPLTLEEDNYTVGVGEWPPCWLPESEGLRYSDEQKVTLADQHFRDSFKMRAVGADELMQSIYGLAGALNFGTPISFDPPRHKMLCARTLKCRDVPREELIRNFLKLDLKHGRLTTEEDRSIITGFVREYGPFIPFDAFMSKHIMDIGDMIDQWASMDMQPQLVMITSEGKERANEPVFAPYRRIEADHMMEPRHFHGKFLMFFEAFAIWHEVAAKIDASIRDGHADHAATDALRHMRAACMQAGQTEMAGGKVVRLERTQVAMPGTEGAAALVESLEERIKLLDEKYRYSKAEAVLAECKDIDRKIERAEKWSKGELERTPPTRKKRAVKPFAFSGEEEELVRRTMEMLANKTSGKTDDLTRRDLQKVRETLGGMIRDDIRLTETEREAEDALIRRQSAEREATRLKTIRAAVEEALTIIALEDPMQELRTKYELRAEVLFRHFIEQQDSWHIENDLHLTEKQHRSRREAAMRRFMDICPLELLPVSPTKKKPGRPKRAN